MFPGASWERAACFRSPARSPLACSSLKVRRRFEKFVHIWFYAHSLHLRNERLVPSCYLKNFQGKIFIYYLLKQNDEMTQLLIRLLSKKVCKRELPCFLLPAGQTAFLSPSCWGFYSVCTKMPPLGQWKRLNMLMLPCACHIVNDIKSPGKITERNRLWLGQQRETAWISSQCEGDFIKLQLQKHCWPLHMRK